MSDAARIEVRLLGPLEVRCVGDAIDLGRGRRRALLAALALKESAPVTIDALFDALWLDHPPSNARTMVHAYVSTIRRSLGASSSRLRTTPEGYVLEVDADGSDLVAWRRIVAAADAAAMRGDWVSARDACDEALSMWRGSICEGISLHGAIGSVTTAFERERHRVGQLRVDALLQLGEYLRAIGYLEPVTAERPLDEAVHARLALAQYLAGQQTGSLATLRGIRSRLREELGVEPLPELLEIEEGILRHDPGLRPERSVTVLRRTHTRWISAVRVQISRRSEDAPLHDVLMEVASVMRRAGADTFQMPGEGTLGVWGLHEPDAGLVRAAAAAAEAVLRLVSTHDGVDIAIAISTATARAPESEPEDALLDARAVSEAARLARSAHGGSILMDDTTADLLGSADRRRDGDAWVLTRARDELRPPGLHGRASELAVLEEALGACERDSTARCVVLVGPGGIGKTRLTTGLVERTATPEIRIGCEHEPFTLVMRRLASKAASAPTSPLVAGGPSLDEVFLTAREGLLELTRTGPLIVVIDDIHRAGTDAAITIARLVRSLASRPILFVVTSRHEEPELGDEAIVLSVRPVLDDDAKRILMEASTGSPLERDVAEILRVAEGNPLHLRQLAAMEVGSTRDGVPARVDMIVRARLDAEPRASRLVLGVLSILDGLGRPQFLDALTPDHIRPSLGDVLRSLHAAGWIEDLDGRRFVHEIVRDAVYEASDLGLRAQTHRRLADLLSRREEDYELDLRVGTQLDAWVRSGVGDPAALREGASLASERLAAAAGKLRTAGDPSACAELLARASDVCPTDDPRRVDLAIEHLHAVIETDDAGGAARLASALDESLGSSEDPVMLAYLHLVKTWAALRSGGTSDSLASIRQQVEVSLPIVETAGHLRAKELGNYLLAWLDYHRGSLAAADARMELVLDLREAVGEPTAVFLPASLLDGPTPLTDRSLRTQLRLIERLGGSKRAETMAQVAGLFALRGDVSRTDACIADAISVADALALPSTTGTVHMEAGVSALRLERSASAIEHLRAADRAFDEAGAGNFRSTALAFLARALLRVGEVSTSLAATELADELADSEDLITGITTRAARGLALAFDGARSGVDLVAEAVEVASATELSVPRADAAVDLAAAHGAFRDDGRALEAAALAADIYGDKGAVGAARSVRRAFPASG